MRLREGLAGAPGIIPLQSCAHARSGRTGKIREAVLLAIRIIKAEPPTGSLNAWPQCSGAYRCIAQVARAEPQRVVAAARG